MRGVATLSRRAAPLPVAMILTLRPSPRTAVVDQLVNAMRDRGASHLRIDGLDDASVTAMTAQLIGLPPGPRLDARLAGAGGNPLYVTEYLRALDEDATFVVRGGVAEIEDDALPIAVRETVLRRMTTLPPLTVEMLRLASLLGREFTLNDLADNRRASRRRDGSRPSPGSRCRGALG